MMRRPGVLFLGAVGLTVLASAAISASGCRIGDGGTATAVAAALPEEGDRDARPSTALADAINEFGFDLLRQVTDSPQGANVVISPFSVHDALSMTANGASGKTLDEMREVLRFGDLTEATSNQAWADMLTRLGQEGETTLTIANSLWLDEGFKLDDRFAQADTDFFGAELRVLDLQSPEFLEAINGWMSDMTEERIEKILDRADPLAVLYLANATYFKGAWKDPFDESATSDAGFTVDDGTFKTVPVMRREGAMSYAETSELQAVKLPYSDGRTSMWVLLPASSKDLASLEASLGAKGLRTIADGMRLREGTLKMPRLETGYERELSEDLKAMGMAAAFDGADFSRMASPAERLFIGRVLHKTFLDVDEKGTEAAAGTVVEMMLKATAPATEGEPFEMVCDRPYMCLIVDDESGAVLFAASIRDPER